MNCTTTSGISDPSFACVASFVTDMVNQLVIVLIGIGLLVFIWGLVQYVIAAGDEEKVKEAKRFIVFGLIAFFVMMSVWGLTNLIVRTFFPTGGNLIAPQFR